MSKLIEKIIETGTVPAHAPSWAKLDDVQWINKLDDIVRHPDKYRDSTLKRALIEEANNPQLKITRYPLISKNLSKEVKVLCVFTGEVRDL